MSLVFKLRDSGVSKNATSSAASGGFGTPIQALRVVPLTVLMSRLKNTIGQRNRMPVNGKTAETPPLLFSPVAGERKRGGGHNGVKMEVETDDGY
jgi:hypothetical protein